MLSALGFTPKEIRLILNIRIRNVDPITAKIKYFLNSFYSTGFSVINIVKCCLRKGLHLTNWDVFIYMQIKILTLTFIEAVHTISFEFNNNKKAYVT